MKKRRRYRKRADQFVIAIQLDLNTGGFQYEKWGSKQYCKKNDWIVNNNNEIYTIDADSFSKTYREIAPGHYIKDKIVWAEKAKSSGSIKTFEGRSFYEKGDYLLYNNEDGSDGYCVEHDKFVEMYELIK